MRGSTDKLRRRVAAGRGARVPVLIVPFLLTGCRFREIVGLELDDISFDRKTTTVRPNRERLGDRLQRLGLRGPSVTGRDTAERRSSKQGRPTQPKSRWATSFQRAGDRTRTGDVQLGKLAFYH